MKKIFLLGVGLVLFIHGSVFAQLPQTSNNNPNWASSCFQIPKEVPNWSFNNGDNIFNYDNNAWATDWSCSCKKDFKKVMKTLYSGGVATQYSVAVCEKCDPTTCNCGVKLNTDVPFIGRCLMYGNTNNTWLSWDTTTVNSLNAFPILMGALMRLLVWVILIVCLWTIIVWWFMMTVPGQYDKGKWLVRKVIYTIAALWSLWLILYLINPNFFK